MQIDMPKSDEGRRQAQQMLDDYNALESTLSAAQKILLERYTASYEKFMFGVCDRAYEAGYNDGLNGNKQ